MQSIVGVGQKVIFLPGLTLVINACHCVSLQRGPMRKAWQRGCRD